MAKRQWRLLPPWKTPSAQKVVCAMASLVAESTTGQSGGGGGEGGANIFTAQMSKNVDSDNPSPHYSLEMV